MTTILFLSVRALAVQLLFLTLFSRFGVAGFTTVTTLTSTTTVWTSTVTLAPHPTTHDTRTTTTSIKKAGDTTTVVVAPSATMSGGGRDPGDHSGSDLRSQVLNSTNYFRAHYEAKPLSWDPTLAQYAQRYTEGCIWEHSVQ